MDQQPREQQGSFQSSHLGSCLIDSPYLSFRLIFLGILPLHMNKVHLLTKKHQEYSLMHVGLSLHHLFRLAVRSLVRRSTGRYLEYVSEIA